MPSTRETVLNALQARLDAYLPTGAELFARNEALPSRVAPGGVVILRDGDPGEPEVTLSPLTYHYEHRAEIDLVVERHPDMRDAVFDALARGIGAALAADRTLGGLCDWIEGQAPAPLAVPIEGAETLKAATIQIVLIYSVQDTLL